MQYIDRLIDLASSEGLWINQRLVYNQNGDVIGRIEIHMLDEHYVNVNLIAIYPEFRKQGYFNQLISLMVRAADMNGDAIQLIPMETESKEIPSSGISNEKLKSIYEKYGFVAEFPEMPITSFTRESK